MISDFPKTAVKAQLETHPGIVNWLDSCLHLEILSCSLFETPSFNFSLPWGAIKTFKLTCTREIDLCEVFKALENMPNLEHVIIRSAYTPRKHAIVLYASTVMLPKLQAPQFQCTDP